MVLSLIEINKNGKAVNRDVYEADMERDGFVKVRLEGFDYWAIYRTNDDETPYESAFGKRGLQ